MNRSTPGLPVHHQLPKSTETHVQSRWCHPAISSSVVPFSSCPQSLPASESFPMSQLFTWGGQSIEVSALASVLPMNTQGWSPLEWTGWISLQSKGLSRVFSSTTVQKHQFFGPHFVPALTLCNGPHSEECASLWIWINPLLTYQLCLSLNAFCDKASRTWASLGFKTRYPGFWLAFESRPHGFKSQAGFWLGSSSSHVGSNSNLR